MTIFSINKTLGLATSTRHERIVKVKVLATDTFAASQTQPQPLNFAPTTHNLHQQRKFSVNFLNMSAIHLHLSIKTVNHDSLIVGVIASSSRVSASGCSIFCSGFTCYPGVAYGRPRRIVTFSRRTRTSATASRV